MWAFLTKCKVKWRVLETLLAPSPLHSHHTLLSRCWNVLYTYIRWTGGRVDGWLLLDPFFTVHWLWRRLGPRLGPPIMWDQCRWVPLSSPGTCQVLVEPVEKQSHPGTIYSTRRMDASVGAKKTNLQSEWRYFLWGVISGCGSYGAGNMFLTIYSLSHTLAHTSTIYTHTPT